MPMLSMRGVSGLVAVLVLSAGCQDKFDMVTQALMTDPETTGITDTGTGTGTGSATDIATSTEPPTTGMPTADTGGDPSGDPSSDPDPTADTTGAPVTCETPESCTAEGEGDISPLALPFFRGTVCVSDNIQPGDKVALSFTTCAHPCLDVGGFKYGFKARSGGGGLELAVAFYHPGTSGAACPPDVFGEFPAEACVFNGPTNITIGPLDDAGAVTLLLPFFTNAEAATYDGGDLDGLWPNAESHMQASDRYFAMTVDAGNAAAPAACGEGVGGCTCRAIGL